MQLIETSAQGRTERAGRSLCRDSYAVVPFAKLQFADRALNRKSRAQLSADTPFTRISPSAYTDLDQWGSARRDMSNTSGFVGVFDANERLQINVLGKFSAAFRGKALRLGRKAQAMLAYISLGGDSEATRERLAGLLWSESDEQLARGSLRHALHELQREIRNVAFPHLTSDKLTIGIDKQWIATDLGAVLERAESGSVHSLLTERRRITDTLLQDLDGIDPAFNTWLRELRTHAHARLLAALERLLPKENNGDVSEAAESIARAITMLDPAHEASTRLMIRTRWAAGDTGRALAIYTELWQYLDREFDTKPSIETQDLIARLRMESRTKPSRPKA